ncbi:response regulator transcription factor [Acidocella sp.]|uniref:response regulator n=1 Tax=Acidocella sp. TaxID=50710 RepID=UPI00261463DD|nr:response regulator transcription factor [Acidocella sp.]
MIVMTCKIFIADDHPIVREGLKAVLSKQLGVDVIGMSGDGDDTIEQVLTLRPDILVLDLAMPGCDGIEIIRRVLAESKDTRIVVVSVNSTVQRIFQALENGARGYLLKDDASTKIIDAIHAVQLGRRYLSPQVAEIVATGLSDRSAADMLQTLSRREREILTLVTNGKSSTEIGKQLHLSPKTVDTYRSRLMQKLEINDITGLVKFAIAHGITSL